MEIEELFRATVAALLRANAEHQSSLAQALGMTHGAVSLKQSGKTAWSLRDVSGVSRHYGIPAADLMSGPTRALERLPFRRRLVIDCEALFRDTVAALRREAGETQADLADALGVTQGAISLKQRGKTAWSLRDVGNVSRHYGISASDLMAGPEYAVRLLPRMRRAALIGGRQEVVPV
ncbi:helix-turn-helix domain-containing protein [Kitasatospora sp. NPDC004723]|uniref:helix-turn-helix transcriptional regulator n=1 Tax=Kitasatospora sp. NPDC004723 TaxID=3154288 RepID=UPI0033B1EDCD